MNPHRRRDELCACGSGRRHRNCCGGTRAANDASQLGSLARAGRHAEMEALARSMVAREPHSGIAWKALGAALRLQGKEALDALQAAARLLPDDAEAHSNLGGALRLAGQPEAAVASYRRALALAPDAAQLHSNLGNALQDLGRLHEALAAHTRALELKPEFAQAYNNRGNVLQGLGHADEAIASYRRALALKPDYADAHTNLAIALRIRNRPEEAQRSCRRALELNPALVPALNLQADLHADRGDFAAAEAGYRSVIAIAPESTAAWAGLAGLRRMSADDTPWLAAVQRIVAGRLPPRQEADLRYALGKYFDDVGEYGTAFGHYRRANQLMAMLAPPHDRAAVSQRVGRIVAGDDAGWLRAAGDAGSASARPVLIVGMPRSGTTLAEQLLASHPQVHGAGELPFWNSAHQACEIARLQGGSAADEVRRIADDGLRLFQELAPDAARVVDKMPANFLYLGLVQAVFPNARIIHLHRDPRDTCLSIYFQPFGPGHSHAHDLQDLAHYWREYCRVMAHWRAVLPAGRMLEVPYEGLTGDTESWARRMLEFIGLPWDPRCLDFHRHPRTVSTFSKWQARQPITGTSVGRWRHYAAFAGPLLQLDPSGPRG
jgi:tetratricopeptide (TPR) repeat protein